MSAESAGREALRRTAYSLYERGLTHGSTGNLSIRLDDGWLMSPTGASLGELDPARLSRLDADGRHVSGDKPTKESFLHLATYQERSASGAVVAGSSLSAATDAIEELEATARLYLPLRRERLRLFTDEQVAELRRRYPT